MRYLAIRVQTDRDMELVLCLQEFAKPETAKAAGPHLAYNAYAKLQRGPPGGTSSISASSIAPPRTASRRSRAYPGSGACRA